MQTAEEEKYLSSVAVVMAASHYTIQMRSMSTSNGNSVYRYVCSKQDYQLF